MKILKIQISASLGKSWELSTVRMDCWMARIKGSWRMILFSRCTHLLPNLLLYFMLTGWFCWLCVCQTGLRPWVHFKITHISFHLGPKPCYTYLETIDSCLRFIKSLPTQVFWNWFSKQEPGPHILSRNRSKQRGFTWTVN